MFVSNTSTLVLLAKVSALEHFIAVSPAIEVPDKVKKEALFKKDSYYARLIEKLMTSGKIIVKEVPNSMLKQVMSSFKLNSGEAAAYALFNKKQHKAILTDDHELIKLCKLENIPFICAMAVIIRLNAKRILARQEALSKLKELNTVHYLDIPNFLE